MKLYLYLLLSILVINFAAKASGQNPYRTHQVNGHLLLLEDDDGSSEEDCSEEDYIVETLYGDPDKFLLVESQLKEQFQSSDHQSQSGRTRGERKPSGVTKLPKIGELLLAIALELVESKEHEIASRKFEREKAKADAAKTECLSGDAIPRTMAAESLKKGQPTAFTPAASLRKSIVYNKEEINQMIEFLDDKNLLKANIALDALMTYLKLANKDRELYAKTIIEKIINFYNEIDNGEIKQNIRLSLAQLIEHEYVLLDSEAYILVFDFLILQTV